MKPTIVLIACFENYINILEKNIHRLPENYTYSILTTDVERVNNLFKHFSEKIYVEEYKENRFNYFEKIYFTYKSTNIFKNGCLLIDIKHLYLINEYLPRLSGECNEFLIINDWDGYKYLKSLYNYNGKLAEKHWFNHILDYFETIGVNLNKAKTILEWVMYFPLVNEKKDYIETIQIIENIYPHNKIKNKPYEIKGYNEGEGLALSAALLLFGLPTKDIRTYSYNKKKVNLI